MRAERFTLVPASLNCMTPNEPMLELVNVRHLLTFYRHLLKIT